MARLRITRRAHDPIAKFIRWFDDARRLIIPNYEAMALATAEPDGKTSVRFVLLKGEDCDRSPEVRVVILIGAGRAFCAVDDLRGMTGPGETDRTYLDPIKQYVEGEGRWPLIVARMRAMSKPVIAIINGHAHGVAGFNLALGCDLRVLADTSTLAIPFAKRGIATGTNLLQQFVGIGKAMEWALLAPALSAAEADSWGLVNRVVPLDRLEQETTELARELVSLRWGPSFGGPTANSALVAQSNTVC